MASHEGQHMAQPPGLGAQVSWVMHLRPSLMGHVSSIIEAVTGQRRDFLRIIGHQAQLGDAKIL